MDQILPLVEALLARIDWISAAMSGFCMLVVGGFAALFARGFELDGWRYKLVWIAVVAISIMPVRSGAKAYIAPSIYEWTYEDSVIEELSKFPFYKALLDHHPESRSGLVRAAIKLKWGRKEALVGATELGAIMTHYLALDLPRTSDDAAKYFGNAVYGVVATMMLQDPGLCVEALYGTESQRDSLRRYGRLPPWMLDRLATMGAQVIVDAVTQPSQPPDPARIAPLRQTVIARMTRDGNPLITNPDQLADDPRRACFAILQALETAQKTLSREDFGPFLRATLPEFLKDDEA